MRAVPSYIRAEKDDKRVADKLTYHNMLMEALRMWKEGDYSGDAFERYADMMMVVKLGEEEIIAPQMIHNKFVRAPMRRIEYQNR